MAPDGSGEAHASVPRLPLVEDGAEFDGRYRWSLAEGLGGLCLRIEGHASRAPRETFVRDVEAVIAAGRTRRLVIEFTDCAYMASAAFGFVVRVFRYATTQGYQVLAVAPSESVRGLMQVLGIDGFLLVVEDLQTAEAFFDAQGI